MDNAVTFTNILGLYGATQKGSGGGLSDVRRARSTFRKFRRALFSK